MVVQKTGVLEIYCCTCKGCNRILVELGKFLEVQQIDRDAEKYKASILVTGDPCHVTKALKKHGKRFEYFEQTSAMNKVTKALKKHGKPFVIACLLACCFCFLSGQKVMLLG